jgi:hypothetical protein
MCAVKIRQAISQVRSTVISVSGYAAFLLATLASRRAIISIEPPSVVLGSKIVIFSHFDKTGRIRDHTRAYIDALRSEGFKVVFVTNAGRLEPPDLDWLRIRAACILIRRNLGYDFGAWRDAMVACGIPSVATQFLLLANDSVYGPLHKLAPMLNRIDFTHADVWSVTDSWQHRFHLQSFFLAFGPQAFKHEAFSRFWRSVRNVRSKDWVVRRYEVGLSRLLIAAGLRCKAVWSYVELIELLRRAAAEEEDRDLASYVEHGQRNDKLKERTSSTGSYNTKRVLRMASERKPINPTADLWRVLIEQGCPFLKRELLRDNPSRVPDVASWLSVVDDIADFETDIIIRDLEKSLKNRSP